MGDDARCSSLIVRGDSMLVIQQVSGKWQCHKEHLRKLRARCKELEKSLVFPVKYEWVSREGNEAADAVSRREYEKLTGKVPPERPRKAG